jgi:hypothetical protein
MRHHRIDSVAKLKRLPVGTRLYVVASLLGPNAPTARVVKQVRSKDIVMLVDDPNSKNYGKVSYLSLPSGTKVEATPNGFAVYEPKYDDPSYPGGELAAEYEFADE